jgi:hypothetical protein
MSYPSKRLRIAGCVAIVVYLALAAASVAHAEDAAPGWEVRSVARPSNFAASDTGPCEELGTAQCDRYELFVTNVGSAPSSGPITITDTLPSQTKLVSLEDVKPEVFSETENLAEWLGSERGSAHVKCSEPSSGTLSCTYGESGEALGPGSEIALPLYVEVTSGAQVEASNHATVEGGGGAKAETAPPSTVANSINGVNPGFGIQDFGFTAFGANGLEDTQAGDHPGAITTTIDFTSAFHPTLAPGNADATGAFPAGGEAKDVAVELPLGLVGDPEAAPTCPESTVSAAGEEELNFEHLEREFGRTITRCPAGSVVGALTIEPSNPFEVIASDKKFGFTTPLYNVTPEGNYPAEFGFSFLGHAVYLFASVIPTPSGYRLRVASPGIARLGVKGVDLTLFGEPTVHDGTGSAPEALFTNPARCSAEGLSAKIEADSWQEPSRWVSTPQEVIAYPEITGCDLLQFSPAIELSPEATEADTPSGYEVTLKVPQMPNVMPDLATPSLKQATVTLPEGLNLSPAGAEGLEACSESQIGLQATETGSDGLLHASPGHCPSASRVGAVEVQTPLLRERLTGSLYVAEPHCGGAGEPACTEASAADGQLFGLYMEVAGSGVVVKLRGNVSVNPSTGQVTTTFAEGPQLPFSELKLRLRGGSRSTLANPQSCGAAVTSADVVPWSSPETPNATSTSAFAVNASDAGGRCGPTSSLTPVLSAGSALSSAGKSSTFAFTLARHDHEQDLSSISAVTPPGLLGMLSEVKLCAAAAAATGTCGPESLIGHSSVTVGSGETPLLQTGDVYLTGPYGDGPFGLSIVTPAVAGPFNLGTIVVRAAILVNPRTAALTVTSNALPRIIDGVPLRIRAVNITVDKPGFMLNPTNCSQQQITAAVTGFFPGGAPGSTVRVSTPYAVTGCDQLPFHPQLAALTDATTSKPDGASLHVRVTSTPGQANIHQVKVDLPVQLPSRDSTLKQACLAAVFEANPASCPTGSVVGTAWVETPVLKSELTGPAYLVSHGGEAFPDLEIVLQGEGITLVLDGNTYIKKGVTSSAFKAVPDAPVSEFNLVLPEGPHSILAAYGNLCKKPLDMPTEITGQNGAVIKQTTRIAVSGCPRHKAHKGKKSKKK